MKEISLPSEHGNLRGMVWDDVDNPIGTIQIIHGLVEYHGRYHETAKYFNERGYIVYCSDHLGHGLHILDGKLRGFFLEENGYEAVIDQLAEMNREIRKNHPTLNHYVISHSLGTALIISLLKRNIFFNGVVLSAAFSINPFLMYLNKLLIWPEYIVKGKRGLSDEMEKLTTIKQNAEFEPNRTTHDYLSSDQKSVDEYIADPLCGFKKTTQMWQDLASGFINLWTKKSFGMMDENIPFYLLTGDKDAVNAHGKQAEEIHNLLIQTGFKSEFRVFENMRHEPFQELERQKVFESINKFYSQNN